MTFKTPPHDKYVLDPSTSRRKACADAGASQTLLNYSDVGWLVALLAQCWSRHTSSVWSPATPSRGQCAVTALVLQDYFGGEILKLSVGESWHFYNRIDGLRLDTTADQFPLVLDYADVPSDREEALADTTQEQYKELSRKFAAALSNEGEDVIGSLEVGPTVCREIHGK
jgi:hypothetical protein